MPLQFTRSDGSQNRWPTDLTPNPGSWHVKLPPNHPKYTLYQTKVAEYLERLRGIKSANPSIMMPAGYALYGHRKPQKDGTVREDVYMFGSTVVNKFRSPAEFFPHAEWLMNPASNLSDHRTCGCQYNKSSTIALEKKSGTSSPLSKKPSQSGQAGPSQPKKQRIEAIVPEEYADGVVVERSIDLRTCRRYRKGELVFFKIPTVNPPAGSDLPAITHWPGLIAEIETKEQSITSKSIDGIAASSSSNAWSMFGGVAPAGIRPPTTEIIRTTLHHIRPLGHFSSSDASTAIRKSREILPFAVGTELFGGAQGWLKIGYEADKVLEVGIGKEAEQEGPKKVRKKGEVEGKELKQEDLQGKALDERWKKSWGRKMVFHDMGTEWPLVVYRLGVALKTAKKISNLWTQTDDVRVLPETIDLSKEDIDDLMSHKKTLYQGLWWQGERIWMEDMVRLRLEGSKLPAELKMEGSVDGCIFARIRLISVEHIEKVSASRDTYRAMVYGDLFELVPSDSDSTLTYPLPVGAKPTEVPVPTQYAAPKGWKYRQINDDGFEVSVDVLDIAGRVYPDLMETEGAWFRLDGTDQDEDAEGDVEMVGEVVNVNGDGKGKEKEKEEEKEGKGTKPGPEVLAIVGLVSGKDSPPRGVQTWCQDLYNIVSKATNETDREMKSHYVKVLRERLGFPAVAPPVVGKSKAVSGVSGTATTTGPPQTLADAAAATAGTVSSGLPVPTQQAAIPLPGAPVAVATLAAAKTATHVPVPHRVSPTPSAQARIPLQPAPAHSAPPS